MPAASVRMEFGSRVAHGRIDTIPRSTFRFSLDPHFITLLPSLISAFTGTLGY